MKIEEARSLLQRPRGQEHIQIGGRPAAGFGSLEHVQIGGRPGFGVGDLEKFEKSEDPLYKCHHDTYTKLQTFGTVVATAVITAGIVTYVVPWLRRELYRYPQES